jgi:peptidoglycan-N-acetylglucosamine deacetylase
MTHALISLTFDDGLDVHLDTALPLLEKYNLKGTFYVPLCSPSLGRRGDEWRKLAALGHELGNHSIFHPSVMSKDWVREGNAIENYTLDRMRMELEVANTLLTALDGKTERSFAFPCSNPILGRPGWGKRTLAALELDRTRLSGWVNKWNLDIASREENYTSVVQDLFYAARCGGIEASHLPAIPENRYGVRGVEGDGCATEEIFTVVDTAVERGAWAVFVFHGIGGGHHLSCSVEAFKKLLSRLAGDDRVSVKTFLAAAKDIWPSRIKL